MAFPLSRRIIVVGIIGLDANDIHHTNISAGNCWVRADDPAVGGLGGLDQAHVLDSFFAGPLPSPFHFTTSSLLLIAETISYVFADPTSASGKTKAPTKSKVGLAKLAKLHDSTRQLRSAKSDPKGPFAPIHAEELAHDRPAPHVMFFSIDRCTDVQPISLVRHDLEGFFYVLQWIFANFRQGWRIICSTLDEWIFNGWDTIRSKKRTFLSLEKQSPQFAGVYAESLGAMPEPLEHCMSALAANVRAKSLDGPTMIKALQVALAAY